MISDLIFAIFITSLLGLSSGDPAPYVPMTAPAEVADAPPAPAVITELALRQLACRADPDPTLVLRAMMDLGLIHANTREDFESYSCFEIPGGMSLAGVTVNSVCGGVLDPAINAENPDLYPPNELIADDERYQMIALGSNEELGVLQDWYRTTMGSGVYGTGPFIVSDENMGVTDGLYTSGASMNEVYCDDILAYEAALDASDMAEPAPVPMDIPVDEDTGLAVMPPPAPVQ